MIGRAIASPGALPAKGYTSPSYRQPLSVNVGVAGRRALSVVETRAAVAYS